MRRSNVSRLQPGNSHVTVNAILYPGEMALLVMRYRRSQTQAEIQLAAVCASKANSYPMRFRALALTRQLDCTEAGRA